MSVADGSATAVTESNIHHTVNTGMKGGRHNVYSDLLPNRRRDLLCPTVDGVDLANRRRNKCEPHVNNVVI